MDWIIDHLRLIFVVGGALAWWLNQRKQTASEEVSPHKDATFEDPELAARTRQIREEIQRKIEQRAKGYTQPRPLESELATPPPIIREELPIRQPLRTATRIDAQRQAEILEEQATLMEKLSEAKAMRTNAQRRVEFEASIADHTVEALAQTRANVLGDLRAPAALRRAFILREVLGPPVALRR